MAQLKFSVGQTIYVVEITGRGAKRHAQVVPCVYLDAGREGYAGMGLLADGDIILFEDAFAFEGEKQATLVAERWNAARVASAASQAPSPTPRKGAKIKP